MERKINIVPGEASESDEETTIVSGSVIAGEASESDSSSSDIDVREAIPAEDHCQQQQSSKNAAKHTAEYTSLLHKKLRERNAALRRSVEDFVHQTADSAAKELNSIDQQLLKSQVTLQDAVTCLRLVRSNISETHNKLLMITGSKYLPIINVEKL